MITLQEFREKFGALLDGFETFWLLQNQSHPDHYPKLMNDSDWFEQFLSYIESVRHGRENDQIFR